MADGVDARREVDACVERGRHHGPGRPRSDGVADERPRRLTRPLLAAGRSGTGVPRDRSGHRGGAGIIGRSAGGSQVHPMRPLGGPHLRQADEKLPMLGLALARVATARGGQDDDHDHTVTVALAPAPTTSSAVTTIRTRGGSLRSTQSGNPNRLGIGS